MNVPVFKDIRRARQRIDHHIHHTPVLTSNTLDEQCQANIFLKCENFQKTGAFKFRGASNAILSLTDKQTTCGVATHSSGNHAQAVAMAAKLRNLPAYIVMPHNSPKIKIAAVKGYGARIIFCEPTLESRETTLEQVVKETGATFVHPYNDSRVIAGQGTAALELLDEQPDLDILVTPVGGGGLLSGTAIAGSGSNPRLTVIGAEPAEADDAYRSFNAGQLIPLDYTETIADGLRTSLGELTFTVIMKHVDEIVTVTETEITEAMRFVWERIKIVTEASAAVPVAALLSKKIKTEGKKIGVIISGGNADLDKLPWQPTR